MHGENQKVRKPVPEFSYGCLLGQVNFLNLKISFTEGSYDRNEPLRLGPTLFGSNIKLPLELQFFKQKIHVFEYFLYDWPKW